MCGSITKLKVYFCNLSDPPLAKVFVTLQEATEIAQTIDHCYRSEALIWERLGEFQIARELRASGLEFKLDFVAYANCFVSRTSAEGNPRCKFLEKCYYPMVKFADGEQWDKVWKYGSSVATTILSVSSLLTGTGGYGYDAGGYMIAKRIEEHQGNDKAEEFRKGALEAALKGKLSEFLVQSNLRIILADNAAIKPVKDLEDTVLLDLSELAVTSPQLTRLSSEREK